MIQDWKVFREGMIVKELDKITKNWKLLHAGIVVRDLDKAVKFWESTGIATFDELTFDWDPHITSDMSVYGKPVDPKFSSKWRLGQIGILPVEFGQPIAGESTYMEFLHTKGEGVHHLGFGVDNFDEAAAYMVEHGMPMMFSATRTGGGWAYFDARKTGAGLIIELIDMAKAVKFNYRYYKS